MVLEISFVILSNVPEAPFLFTMSPVEFDGVSDETVEYFPAIGVTFCSVL
jgi:hypothetical protein